jgi:hypothetical protein
MINAAFDSFKLQNMPVQTPKRRSERLSRRKFMVMKKARELAQFCDADVTLIIRTHKDCRYYTYNSTGLKAGEYCTFGLSRDIEFAFGLEAEGDCSLILGADTT